MIVVRGDRAGDSPSWTLDRLGRRVPALEGGARTEEIEAGLAAHEGVRTIASDVPDDEVRASLAIVHEPEYLEFLDLASGQATPEHPVMAPDWSAPGVPADTPVCAGSAAAARSAVRTALTAARALQRGSNVAYALCRPPGHHAGRRSMGGYCYLNNAAAAVARLRAETGVAVGIIDIDFHYGNGTASIVADMADVWLESIHASTTDHFPWRNSFPHNPRHRHHEYDNSPSAADYLGRLDEALQRLAASCDVLVASLGYDIVWGDPHGTWSLAPMIFEQIGRRLVGTGLPVCVIQEGGYARRQLGRCAFAFANGVTTRSRSRVPAS